MLFIAISIFNIKIVISMSLFINLQAALPDEIPILSLPCRGSTISDVLSKLSKREKNNLQLPQGHATVSGAVYMQGQAFSSDNDCVPLILLTN